MKDRFISSLLARNEQIKLTARQHWFVLVREILPEIGSIAAIAVLTTLGWQVWVKDPLVALGYLFIIFPILSMGKDILTWRNHEYIITNRRVIQVFGILTKNVTDSSLEKVNDVKMVQSFWGRLFNYGNIEIFTASELGINRFTRLEKPILFKTTMLDAKEELKGVDADDMPRQVISPSEARRNLLALKQSGVISPDEYDEYLKKVK